MYTRRDALKVAASALVAGASSALLAGCGGSSNNSASSVPSGNRTGRFYSGEQLALIGASTLVRLGRGFVTLQNAIPTEVGFELNERAFDKLPVPAFNVPDIYFTALPPEADATPFRVIAFSNWSGHTPVGIGDVAHLHPLFCFAGPQAPQIGNPAEQIRAKAEEVPTGYLLDADIPGAGATIVPGIGEAYEYPESPQLQQGWNTSAQNYFFYNGHMNGIGAGATFDFLRSHRSQDLPITTPAVYPKPGYYPTRNRTFWDSDRGVHVFLLDEFQQAARTL